MSSQRSNSSKGNRNSSKNGTGSSGRRTKKELTQERARQEAFRQEVILWVVIAVSLLLFIGNLGIGGRVGGMTSAFLFGLFGLFAYLVPLCILIGSIFMVVNRENRLAARKLTAAVIFLLFLCMLACLLTHGTAVLNPVQEYLYAVEHKSGGGFLGACLAYLFFNAFGQIGAYIVDFVVIILCLVFITGKSTVRGMKDGGRRVYESAKEAHEVRVQEREELRSLRMDHKVTGVAKDTRIAEEDPQLTEVTQKQPQLTEAVENKISRLTEEPQPEEVKTKPQKTEERTYAPLEPSMQELFPEKDFVEQLERSFEQEEPKVAAQTSVSLTSREEDFSALHKDLQKTMGTAEAELPPDATVLADGAASVSSRKTHVSEAELQQGVDDVAAQIAVKEEKPPREYVFPRLSLLKKETRKAAGNTRQQLRETAQKLQTTLETFGVKVTVTDISCGPSVTRYEIQPELGVKVSKIVNLADDIKLNLAASDIRIEAPIPGKAAVGIEVPNKENVTVSFRELIESEEFAGASSKISFAVGRDISGKIVVTDIAKMPHLLIAGATGSGKSVCINTIIMSILYKAKPEEVKLIMIDPKVVELSVYNGIPHLMIPVVTDPKKAAAALNWAVEEMTDRYQRFAEAGVRKIDEYNAKLDKIQVPEGQEAPKRMSQILIIVDELADLMMVASRDVEDAICRLAQLARAAGIHLVIATQRPSVNVITGLIKANMPSRIAFAVTSGIDSRTILDMNGAEKLLGKGDMLFHPQGAPKPIRVQGALVSDEEVSRVVEYIKEKNGPVSYSNDVQEKMESMDTGTGQAVPIADMEPDDGRDAYFTEAAQVIVDKEKASIGMLQRYLKVGFNRAARIMDQLEEAGVVGPEEGTKPRKVLMSSEELQQFIDENTQV